MPKFLEVTDKAAARTVISAANRAQVYYAKDYGVVANGDSGSPTNDYDALQSLISTVSSNGGGVVLLPVGTVQVNSAVSIASNVTLRGHGWKSVLKLGGNIAGFGVITVEGSVSNIVIEDLKIEGNRTGLAGLLNSGIWGRSPGGYSNVTIRNVWVDNPSYVGIGFLGSTTRANVTENIRVENCTITGAKNHGILAQDGVDRFWAVNNTVVEHGGGTYEGLGIVVGRGGYDIFVTGNYIDSTATLAASEHSISLDGVLGRVVCANNTVLGGVGFGIEVGNVIDGSVTGNVIRGGTRNGIMFTTIGAGNDLPIGNTNVTVSGNVIEGSAAGGIGFYMGSSAASQNVPASGTIVRNRAYTASVIRRVYDDRRLYECTTSGTTHATVKPAAWGATALGDTITDGTSVWTDRGNAHTQIAITGNTISDCSTSGISLDHAYGVSVVGNVITGCGTSGIAVASNTNMFFITGNTLQGNNRTMAASNANIFVVAYSGGLHHATVSDNRILDGGVVDFLAIDSVTNLRIDDRFPANGNQPSVAFGDTFFTQNSSATSLYSLGFANTRDGRVITIRVGDANTSFTHSASGTGTMRLLGGVNFTAPNGTMMAFAWSNGLIQWIEIYRSSGIPAATLALSTTQAVGFGSVELGHASDTSITRTAPGQIAVEGNPVGIKVAVPATAGATGVVGQWAAESGYLYICVATNTWERVAIATW